MDVLDLTVSWNSRTYANLKLNFHFLQCKTTGTWKLMMRSIETTDRIANEKIHFKYYF